MKTLSLLQAAALVMLALFGMSHHGDASALSLALN